MHGVEPGVGNPRNFGEESFSGDETPNQIDSWQKDTLRATESQRRIYINQILREQERQRGTGAAQRREAGKKGVREWDAGTPNFLSRLVGTLRGNLHQQDSGMGGKQASTIR